MSGGQAILRRSLQACRSGPSEEWFGEIAEGEISTILLEPQRFEVDRQQAIEIAIRAGLAPASSYHVNIVLGPHTRSRLAWQVENPDAGSGSFSLVILDVASGQLYARGPGGPKRAQ